MDKTWAPPRRPLARHLTERTTTPLRPWPTPAKLTPIRPPPPSYVQQTYVPWTKRDDRRLEADTWSYIRCEMNALEEQRINPLHSFIRVVPVTDERPSNGLADREHQRQEHGGAGQQAASHQGARPQQMAQPQKVLQQQMGEPQQVEQQMEQPEQVQQRPPEQQASEEASGVADDTGTPGAGDNPANYGSYKFAKRRNPWDYQRRKSC
ncbi:uncharacterized protein LTHEOB_6408 [Lasiodiplodia theobromae]|uniref:uncharacterized protein n=1 Tax=Lasiodiplodia theobromae TaxID=45133 RepID=UPI0015C3322F|nr:uncharacterized protein LTHEOB_6408 [Lasiodiplodia theobromae]KAF4544290.1 hypothetical protein LTHEOB_6408 [Lasiodiplodia theobromae]